MIKKLFGYGITPVSRSFSNWHSRKLLLALFSIVFFAHATMFGFLVASVIWSVAGVATFLFVLAVRWIVD